MRIEPLPISLIASPRARQFVIEQLTEDAQGRTRSSKVDPAGLFCDWIKASVGQCRIPVYWAGDRFEWAST